MSGSRRRVAQPRERLAPRSAPVSTRAAPALEQRLHAAPSTSGSLSMHSTRSPAMPAGRRRRGDAGLGGRAAARRAAARPRTSSRGPAPTAGSMRWPSTLPMRSTMDRPRPRPRTALAVSSRRWNSLKISARLALGDAGPGVVHLTASRRRAGARRAAPCPLARVLDGVGEQVLQQRGAAAGGRSAPTGCVGTMRSSSPFSRASGSNSTFSCSNTSSSGKVGDLRLEPPGVEPRDVDQHVEDLLHRLQRGVDVARELASWPPSGALDQARRVEPRRVERLQHVVAGGRQEARLVEIGLVGLALGDGQRLVDLASARRCARATRRSSVSLARASASAASTRSVMSE